MKKLVFSLLLILCNSFLVAGKRKTPPPLKDTQQKHATHLSMVTVANLLDKRDQAKTEARAKKSQEKPKK
jgi:hypothetical protein